MPVFQLQEFEGELVLSGQKVVNYPADWHQFPLTAMMTLMEQAAYATFANCRDAVQPLLEIDFLLTEDSDALLIGASGLPFASVGLFMRMLLGLRAAARLVFAGQQYEARAVLRSSLECSVYAWALSCDPALGNIWVNRDSDFRTRKAARKAFGWTRLLKHLTATSPRLGHITDEVYDELIDLGAHPNPGGLIGSAWLHSAPDGSTHMWSSQGGGSPESLRSGLREQLRLTFVCFELLRISLPQRMAASGIGDKVAAIFSAAGLSLGDTPC
jgi:hypothetical protein